MSNLVYPLGDLPESQNAVDSHIDGAFTGWAGRTIYRLRNGQIWQQVGYGYSYRYAYMPRVLIVPSGDGHSMFVEGLSGRVQVRRVR